MVSFSSLTERAFFSLSSRFSWRLARAWMPYYPYMFTPGQLAYLVNCLDRTREFLERFWKSVVCAAVPRST